MGGRVLGARPGAADGRRGDGLRRHRLRRRGPRSRAPRARDRALARGGRGGGSQRPELGLGERVAVVIGDLLEPVGPGRLDVVVANPPYIPSAAIDALPAEVSRFEPRLALDGGPDGMAVARRIIAGAAAGAAARGMADDGDRAGAGRRPRFGDGRSRVRRGSRSGATWPGATDISRGGGRRRPRREHEPMATRLVIEGGVPLRGQVEVSAAKNAALPALCATLLTAEPVVLENVPELADVVTTRSLLEGLGARDRERAGRQRQCGWPSSRATRRPTSSCPPCAPPSSCSARCWRAAAWRGWPCPGAARSA